MNIKFIEKLNEILDNPNRDSIYDLFEKNGYIRFNMLYISPFSFKHLKEKLLNYGLKEWKFTENELFFKLRNSIVRFKGLLNIVIRENKIFCIELDFDPIISNDDSMSFLQDIETFLKKCDACFFMSYEIDIDEEIISQPISKSIEFLLNRR